MRGLTYFRMTALFLLGALGHWWWTTYLSFWGVAPQLLLVLTFVVAARRGPVPAMSFGFAWGLVLDVYALHLMGAASLALTLSGYLAGNIRRQVDVSSLAPQSVILAAGTWGFFLFTGLLGLIFTKSFTWPGWGMFLLAPVLNCVLAPLLFWVWDVAVES
ncbi:MAG: rod shape-determining protein MreD [Elusimicrobia bacterium]|nr:rod shape-determining protein MreD [Elusimicrobiota bacterium]